MKVAIIGTGISGLAAAHALKNKAELTLLEADRRVGGHANTVVVESERGFESVDTGFIVFNERNYPEFSLILEELEVPSRPSSMSFSYSDGRFEYTGRDLNGLFAVRRNLFSPRYLSMLAEFTRFQRLLRELVASGEQGASLDEFLAENRFSDRLRDQVVVPLVASVWSADPTQMSSFPVGFLARFLDNHGLLSLRGRPRWRTVEGGSWTYVNAITEPFRDRIRTNSPVERIRRFQDRVEVTVAGEQPEAFDQVVIATHSDQALSMLADPDPVETELLGEIAYQPNRAMLHTDESVMPSRHAAWASWNYRAGSGSEGSDEPAMLTYDMNRLQTLGCRRNFFVSLNMVDRIDPDAVIDEYDYAHPVFTPGAIVAQDRWAEISGVNRTHYCGAYWRNGFHEDGAFSGLRAARAVEAAIEGAGPDRETELPGRTGLTAVGLESAIYEGSVRHRRFGAVNRQFSYRVFMIYLDLSEVDEAMSIHPLWSTRPRSPARFRRADYLGPVHLPLDRCVRDRVEAETGERPQGPIRMLTNLRYFGVVENPVTFYYCFAPDGHELRDRGGRSDQHPLG